jgi:formyltetrahydrofolate synthetase
VYGLDKEDSRLRGKVKQMLLQEFTNELLFVTVSNNDAQVVISKNVLTNATKDSFMMQNKDFVLKEAAKFIKHDILALIQSVPDLPWSPTVDSLQS